MTSTPILRAATPTLPASSSACEEACSVEPEPSTGSQPFRFHRAFHWKPTLSVPRFHFHLNATVTQTLNPRRPPCTKLSGVRPQRPPRKGSRVSSHECPLSRNLKVLSAQGHSSAAVRFFRNF